MSTTNSSVITSPLAASAKGSAVRYRHRDSHGYSALCAPGVDPRRPRSRTREQRNGADGKAHGHAM